MKFFSSLIVMFALSTQVYAQNVLTVSATGGDYASPSDAVAAIGSTLPAASTNNRYLIKLLPGSYQVREMLELPRYTSLAGSGRQTTRIWGDIAGYTAGFGPLPGAQAVIAVGSYSELSALTVINVNQNTSNYVVSARYVTDAVLRDVTALSSGRADSTGEWKTAVWIEKSKNVRLTHVSAKSRPKGGATCNTAVVRSSQVVIEDSEFTSNGCSMAVAFSASEGSQVDIYNSRFNPVNTPIRTLNALSTDGTAGYPQTRVSVKNSTMVGRIIAGSGGHKIPPRVEISFSEVDGQVFGLYDPVCFSVHDSQLTTLGPNCY